MAIASFVKTFFLFNNNPEIVVYNNHIKIPTLNRQIKQTTTQFQSLAPIKFYQQKNGYSHNMYSAVDIMDSYDAILAGKKPLIEPEVFKDKIVVIGANVPTSVGLNDNKNTPMSANHPGVDIQATVIDNLIHYDFLKIIPN